VKLAKTLHPDRYSGSSEQMRELAAEVFARVARAHDVLSDGAQRVEYCKELQGGTSEENRRAVVDAIMGGEQEFNAGMTALKARSYEQALAHFQRALEFDSEEGDFHALSGWARFLLYKDDKAEAAAARHSLERARNLAPSSPTGYYYAGMLHKACSELHEAKRMFRLAVEKDPKHVEAGQELRLMTRRMEKESKGSGGLFGGLGFRRRK